MRYLVFLLGLAACSDRDNYCSLACSDMRKCQFMVPPQCEAHCVRGHRQIDLPLTCDELKKAIEKVGFLF